MALADLILEDLRLQPQQWELKPGVPGHLPELYCLVSTQQPVVHMNGIGKDKALISTCAFSRSPVYAPTHLPTSLSLSPSLSLSLSFSLPPLPPVGSRELAHVG